MYTSGCPKYQNKCCHSIGPPFCRLKMRAPRFRSASSAIKAAVRMGNESKTRMLLTRTDQVNTGMRNMVMPGARRPTIVATKLTPPRIVPSPLTASPTIQRLAPDPGVFVMSESGV
jgi:hypothetical protein